MQDIKVHKEKALLVGVIYGDMDKNVADEHLEELELLAQTAGAEILGKITQRLRKFNPQYLVGKGKAEEIVNQAKELDVQLIIFDDDLSPAQSKNFMSLAKELKVIDRGGLILDIFRQHAQSREAKTQVELAHLEYLLPRLTRQWTHLERQMGGIGTRAGMGETQIEIDRRLIRTRISKLKIELEKIDKERTIQSKGRQNFFRVSLVGYTNAGKSTLMNALSGSDVFVQDQLFATLDTTIRQVNLNDTHQILLSDTVGFVRKLPHDLVASFKSTLKVVVDSDLLLIVLDASSSYIQDHFNTIRTVLTEIEAGEKQHLIVLNKIDQIDNIDHLNSLKRSFTESVFISALDKLRLDDLIKSIQMIMEKNFETVDVDIPFSDGKTISEIQDRFDVLIREYHDKGVRMTVKGPSKKIKKILSHLT